MRSFCIPILHLLNKNNFAATYGFLQFCENVIILFVLVYTESKGSKRLVLAKKVTKIIDVDLNCLSESENRI